MHLFTHSALLEALGWSLFNSLWQMGLLWLLYRLLITIFRNMSSHNRHNLAMVLLVVGSVGFAIEGITAYFISGSSAPTFPGGFLWNTVQPTPLWLNVRKYMGDLLPWCSSLYLVVLGFLLVRYFNHYYHSKNLRYSGLSKMQPQLRVFMEETSRRMGIRRPVKAWLSSLVDVPMTLGYLKPIILLPVAMINHLSIEQAEAILLHELSHIRRNDYLLHLAVTALELLFFFNPFARLLIGEVKKEREHRCDDWVMQFRYDPCTYVSALLSLATHRQYPQPMALAATGENNDRLLLQRVRRILRQNNSDPNTRERRHARPLLLLLFTIAAATLFGLSKGPMGDRLLATRKRDLPATILQTPVTTAVAHTTPITDGRVNLLIRQGLTLAFAKVPVTSSRPQKKKLNNDRMKAPPAPSAEEPNNDETADLTGPVNADWIQQTGVDADAPAAPVTEEFATVVKPNNRDYSIGNSSTSVTIGSGQSTATQRPSTNRAASGNYAFVPNSSFSYQLLADSTSPKDHLIYLQQFSTQELAEGVKKIQEQYLSQLSSLQQEEVKAAPGILNQRHFRAEENKLLLDYNRKIKELQQKMEKATRRLRIVYI